MTAPRAKIESSLAERGRPVMWANEQEAAVLSGFAPEKFRQMLPDLEAMGFPQINPQNGLRSIPAILTFWRLDIDSHPLNPAQSAIHGEEGHVIRQPGKWGARA